jgi:hypothetical protein
MRNIVVFDLDETIGFFAQLNRVWMTLVDTAGLDTKEEDFFAICNKFPKVFRPNILKTLDTLVRLRKKKQIAKIVVYTNNQGPEWWTKIIVRYLEHKLGKKIFDTVITKYGPNSCRTTPRKTYEDLVKCCKLKGNENICFIDDLIHSDMNISEKVTHIYVNSYNYFYSNEEIGKRLSKLGYGREILYDINSALEEYLLDYNSKTKDNTKIDRYIKLFLKDKKPKTKKRKLKRKHRTTRKKWHLVTNN